MISVEKAKFLVRKASSLAGTEQREILEAVHFVLAENVFSPIHFPPFNQSAMDGYSIQFRDRKKTLIVTRESAAGKPFEKKIISGQAVRIFTGAMIPKGTDTVVAQEKVIIKSKNIQIEDPTLKKGTNIRMKGSQIIKGELVLKKNTELNTGAIGVLASLGITSVKVFRKPKITLLITGNELVKPGKFLKSGQIYESNSFCITAALSEIKITPQKILFVPDNEKDTLHVLQSAIKKSDMILITGGISVGDYDFTGKSLQKLKVKNIFYKVAQKPGKPVFFGRKGKCLIFGLPGNPAASLSCFYEYVFPSLQIMQGKTRIFLEKKMLPVNKQISKKSGLALFLKAKTDNERVIILQGQESGNILAFAHADCMVYVPAENGNVKKNALVETHILP